MISLTTWTEIAYEYLEHKQLDVSLSETEPVSQETLWLQLAGESPKTLGVSIDLYEPGNSDTIWFHVDVNTEESEILKLKNNNEETISVRYYNSKFILHKNGFPVDEIELNDNEYYLYIQQKDSDLFFSVEAI